MPTPDSARPRTIKRPKWADGFLAALRVLGNVTAACGAAAVGRRTVYDLRAADPEFAREWAEAEDESADRLEQEARRRAHDGVRRLKFHQGYPVMVPAAGADGTPLTRPALNPDGTPALNPDGTPRVEPVMVPYVEHEYSDTLLIFLLKALRPEKYRERYDVAATVKGELVVKKLGGPASLDDL